jgi:hypothetical protein
MAIQNESALDINNNNRANIWASLEYNELRLYLDQ